MARFLYLIVFLFFMLSCTACSYDPLIITGTVVDESGNALSDVSVQACYSGWGWGEAGYLVWDKATCSETVLTDSEGVYSISFEGPDSSRLRARKEGWVQSDSYNATHSRIVMTSREDRSARLRDAAKKRDLQRSKRKNAETDMVYYCRVVLPETRPVRLQYLDEVLVVTPAVLESENQAVAMFAVQGSSRAVNAFAEELVLKVDGVAQDVNFFTKAVESESAEGLHLIEFQTQSVAAWCDATVDLLVPSVKAMFEANIHACAAE